MTRPSSPPTPALRRRGAAWWAALLLAGAAVAQPASTPASPRPAAPAPVADAAPEPCGEASGFGVLQEGAVAPDGRLALRWTLLVAPRPTARVRPLVFVDGRLAADLGPIELACATPMDRTVPDLRARRTVHWLLHGWPPVPDELAALDFPGAVAAYAARQPPGVFAPADVGWHRVAGAPPLGRDAAPVRPVPADDPLAEDEVAVRGAGIVAEGAGGRLVRAAVGDRVPVRVAYTSPDAADAVVTCLLDGAQVDAFDGAPWRAVRLEPGRRLVVDGSVPVPAPGWHRLHCLLLPDDATRAPFEVPRPLLALYLWGDGP